MELLLSIKNHSEILCKADTSCTKQNPDLQYLIHYIFFSLDCDFLGWNMKRIFNNKYIFSKSRWF
jgi:hypothetical protein